MLKDIPLGRTGDPEHDIGRVVASLVHDDFSYLTGATLMLGGEEHCSRSAASRSMGGEAAVERDDGARQRK
jgi:hypothetical protein